MGVMPEHGHHGHERQLVLLTGPHGQLVGHGQPWLQWWSVNLDSVNEVDGYAELFLCESLLYI